MKRPFVSSLHAPLSSTSFDYWWALALTKGMSPAYPSAGLIPFSLIF